MDARTNTREGGKDRTAAARSTSRDFQPGDPVAITFCGMPTRGEVVRVVDGEFDLLLVRTGNVEVYRNGSDVAPIEPAPEFIETAVMDDVADEDALVAASLDAATLSVRICGELAIPKA